MKERKVKSVTCVDCGIDLIPSECIKHHALNHRHVDNITFKIKEYYPD